MSAIEKFVSGQDVFVSLPTGFGKSLIYGLPPTTVDKGSLHDLRSLATASIAKYTQRCTYVLLHQKAHCDRSPTTCYNTGHRALWGEPEEEPTVGLYRWFVRIKPLQAGLSLICSFTGQSASAVSTNPE